GMSWLAQVDEYPVGFLVAETLGSSLFIAELSLHLEWQGKGIGRRLIGYVAEQARKKGYTSLTLTTFRDVPWNAPLYARLGFEMLADETLPALLRQKREEEAAHGQTYELRCAMRLMLR
ncbi:MAG: GNAT family N-acetyltransferase, partial [Citrobacter sp.]